MTTSLPVTLIALILDKGSLSIELARLCFVLILGLVLYSLTIYAAFLSDNKAWTRALSVKFLKSLAISSGMVLLGLLGLYFQAQAYNQMLAINWFGLIWLLILFSGLWFNKTSVPAA
ncbi:MAG: hypothetical protein Q8R55_05040 [Candidatus Taylorbacteria bacterium]|nr:hypothetical protein [Candidatus Taylorbacteria bacterium]